MDQSDSDSTSPIPWWQRYQPQSNNSIYHLPRLKFFRKGRKNETAKQEIQRKPEQTAMDED